MRRSRYPPSNQKATNRLVIGRLKAQCSQFRPLPPFGTFWHHPAPFGRSLDWQLVKANARQSSACLCIKMLSLLTAGLLHRRSVSTMINISGVSYETDKLTRITTSFFQTGPFSLEQHHHKHLLYSGYTHLLLTLLQVNIFHMNVLATYIMVIIFITTIHHPHIYLHQGPGYRTCHDFSLYQ